MKNIIVFLTIMLFALSSNLKADEKNINRPQNKILEPVPFVLQNNVCYTAKDAVTLGKLFADHHALWSVMKNLDKNILSLNSDNQKLRQQVTIWRSTSKKLKESNAKSLNLLKAMNNDYAKLKGSETKRKIVFWSILSASFIISGAFGIAYAAK